MMTYINRKNAKSIFYVSNPFLLLKSQSLIFLRKLECSFVAATLSSNPTLNHRSVQAGLTLLVQGGNPQLLTHFVLIYMNIDYRYSAAMIMFGWSFQSRLNL